MNEFIVYALGSNSGKICIGSTNDLDKRLKRHNWLLRNKETSYTSIQGGLWELIYKEEYATRKEAMNREKQLKSAKGRKFIRSELNRRDRTVQQKSADRE